MLLALAAGLIAVMQGSLQYIQGAGAPLGAQMRARKARTDTGSISAAAELLEPAPSSPTVSLTASTGIASCAIGALALSICFVGLGSSPAHALTAAEKAQTETRRPEPTNRIPITLGGDGDAPPATVVKPSEDGVLKQPLNVPVWDTVIAKLWAGTPGHWGAAWEPK